MTTTTPVSKTFRILNIVTVLLVGLATLPALIAIVVVWLPGDLPRELYSEDIAIHRVHAIAISVSNWILFGSLLTQLRRPQDQIGAMILAVATLAILIPFDLISPFFTPLELLALALLIAMLWFHPGRASLQWRPLHRGAVAVSTIGAIPWLIYASGQLQTQLNGPATDPHVELGHYGFSTAMTLIILAAAAIGATSLPGWRTTTILAATGATVFGVVSIILPNDASSVASGGGAAAIAWAAALLAVTWSRSNSDTQTVTDQAATTRVISNRAKR